MNSNILQPTTEPKIPMTRAQIFRLLAEYPNLATDILAMLPKKEAYVLKHSYGLGGAPLRTAIALSIELGVSLSRIYQIRRRAIILVCHAKRKRVIVKYIMDHMIKIPPCKTKQKNLRSFANP